MTLAKAAAAVAIAGTVLSIYRLAAGLAGHRTPLWLSWVSLALWLAALALAFNCLRRARNRRDAAQEGTPPP